MGRKGDGPMENEIPGLPSKVDIRIFPSLTCPFSEEYYTRITATEIEWEELKN